jgi:hypothetical protein
MTTETATHTLSIIGGRPHIDGRPLEPNDPVELTAWELARLVHECIDDFRWNIDFVEVEWGGNVDLGEPTPARILAGPFVDNPPDDLA